MDTLTKNKLHLRWMIRRDMPEVLAIERDVFEFPWLEEDFVKCLRQRNCIGIVAEQFLNGPIIGFMIYELHKSRLHLLNIAVYRKHQRQGIGRAMIETLKGKLSQERRVSITAKVRESNLPAQLFFRSQRFFATELLPDCYMDSTEDAYLFEYEI